MKNLVPQQLQDLFFYTVAVVFFTYNVNNFSLSSFHRLSSVEPEGLVTMVLDNRFLEVLPTTMAVIFKGKVIYIASLHCW